MHDIWYSKVYYLRECSLFVGIRSLSMVAWWRNCSRRNWFCLFHFVLIEIIQNSFISKFNAHKLCAVLTFDFGTTFSLVFRIDWVHRRHRCDRQLTNTFDNEISAPKTPIANGWTLCDVFAAFGQPSAYENQFCSDYVHLCSFRRHHENVRRWYWHNSVRTIESDNHWNPNRTTNALRCRYWCSRPDHRCFGDLE